MDKTKFTLLGVCLAALAAAIAAYASSSVTPSQLTNFKISGDAAAPLYPGGAAAPVDLGFTNPNTFAITVSDVAVKVAGSSSAACGASNFAVGSQFAGEVRLAPGETKSLSQLGIPQANWPRVAMVNSPSSQNACESASVQLSYTGEATGNVAADTPAGVASGPVYVNGRLFDSGGIAYGATVRIEPGGRLELRTQAGTITVFPPAGKTIRFTVHRVSVKLPFPLNGSAVSSAKPKQKVYTELKLTGGELSRCPARPSAESASQDAPAAAQPSPLRSLWVKGGGSVRVRGRFGVASGRGAWWLTQDSCRGTLVKVKRSSVRVDDVTKQAPVFVEAGHSYLAHAAVKVSLKRKAG
jgi:hypothetical protein